MIRIFENEKKAAQVIASEMAEVLKDEEYPLFCLAAGGTPRTSYQEFIKICKKDDLISKAEFIGLDEWVGVPSETVGSCYQMLDEDLFKHLPIDKEQIHFFDTMVADLEGECQKADEFLKKHKISYSLMGVGMNGHIGLNEPDALIKDYCSIVELSEITKDVAPKYFKEKVVLEEGITLGIKQIIDSKRVVVAIFGKHKASIVKKIIEENTTEDIPAKTFLGHSHIDFFLDEDAAGLLIDRRGTVRS